MRLLYRLIFIPIAIVFVVFAVANRHDLTLMLWPLPFEIDLPVYVAVLGALVAGILIGGSAQWFSDGKWRRRARAGNRKANALERELTTLQASQAEAGQGTPPDGQAKLPSPGRLPRLPRLRAREGAQPR